MYRCNVNSPLITSCNNNVWVKSKQPPAHPSVGTPSAPSPPPTTQNNSNVPTDQ